MESEIELGKRLIDELTDLWVECNNRCERIESIIKQINEKSDIISKNHIK